MIAKAIFFDLDNTLFDVTQFMSSAFRQIAKYLLLKYDIDEEKGYLTLFNNWKKDTSMYPKLFDDSLKQLGLLDVNIKEIVKIYNEHICDLELYPHATTTLIEFKKKGYFLGIITDGNINRQKNKIKSLELEKYVDKIIYSKNNPKPSVIPYEKAINFLNRNDYVMFYVGDNPFVDFSGAKKKKFKTIRMLLGEFIDVPSNDFIDYEFKNFKDLKKFLIEYGKNLANLY